MTIRSNPPGALVYVDDYTIGVTPVSTSFIYYGTRKIRLVKDGYETLTVMQPISPPWAKTTPRSQGFRSSAGGSTAGWASFSRAARRAAARSWSFAAFWSKFCSRARKTMAVPGDTAILPLRPPLCYL